MLQAYEIYDATSVELQAELERLKNTNGSNALQSLIAEELEERRQSQRLSTELQAFASNAACAGDIGRGEPLPADTPRDTKVHQRQEVEDRSEEPKEEEDGGGISEESPFPSQAGGATSEAVEGGKGKSVLELAVLAYKEERLQTHKARKAVVRHAPQRKQARVASDRFPPNQSPKHPKPQPTQPGRSKLGNSAQEEHQVTRLPLGNVKNIDCGVQLCENKTSARGEVDTPTSDKHENEASAARQTVGAILSTQDGSTGINEGASLEEIASVASSEPPTEVSPLATRKNSPRSVAPDTPLKSPTALGVVSEGTAGAPELSSGVGGDSEMISGGLNEPKDGPDTTFSSSSSNVPLDPTDGPDIIFSSRRSSIRILSPEHTQPEPEVICDIAKGRISSRSPSPAQNGIPGNSSEGSSCQSQTGARATATAVGSRFVSTQDDLLGGTPACRESSSRQSGYCATDADLQERREASVSAGVDRWEDWDMEDGGVCSWPSTPDSSSQTRLSLAMKKHPDGIYSQPYSSRTERDEPIVKDRKRQGIGSSGNLTPAQLPGPHRCNDENTSPLRKKRGHLASIYPTIAQIFSAFASLKSRGTPINPTSDTRNTTEPALINKCKSFIANFESWNESLPLAAGRSICVIGTPDHPEVERVVTEAVSKVEGWRIEQDVDLHSQAKTSSEASGPTSRPSSCFKKASAVNSPKNCHLQRWNLLWTWSSRISVPHTDLLVWQRVNHYPNSKALTRKDLFKKHLARFQSVYSNKTRPGSYFDIFPTTFLLPKEYALFVDNFNSSTSASAPTLVNLWIVKPVSMSCGRGIHLVDNPMDVSLGESIVVQRYITNPLLVGGYKFDLRLYALVTSFAPLEAWLYKDGFARFATEKFSLEAEQLGNSFVHLTNSSIQQSSDWKTVDEDNGPKNPFGGCIARGSSKTSLDELWKLLGCDCDQREAVWRQCRDVVLTALFVAQDGITNQVNSFELFGFDLIIDDSFKVWLLEANSSPSLECATELDKRIKVELVKDVISLVDPPCVNWRCLIEALKELVKKPSQSRRDGRLHDTTTTTTTTTFAEQIEAILGGRRPRQYGEIPTNCANFEMLAPSQTLQVLQACKNPLN